VRIYDKNAWLKLKALYSLFYYYIKLIINIHYCIVKSFYITQVDNFNNKYKITPRLLYILFNLSLVC
jgi:hypothetical protein